MKIYSESSLSNRVNYINTVPYLKEYFQKYVIRIVNADSSSLRTAYQQYPFEGKIKLEDSMQDGNLRIIETYLPEILLMFANNCKGSHSIYSTIKMLSKRKFFHSSEYYTELFLRIKMIQFFEMLLFRDRTKEIWNGDYDPFICFVLKENDELEYYFLYEAKKLVRLLLEVITVKFEKYDNARYAVKFALLVEA